MAFGEEPAVRTRTVRIAAMRERPKEASLSILGIIFIGMGLDLQVRPCLNLAIIVTAWRLPY